MAGLFIDTRMSGVGATSYSGDWTFEASQKETFTCILADRYATAGNNLQYYDSMAAISRLLISFQLERDFKRTGIASSIGELTPV